MPEESKKDLFEQLSEGAFAVAALQRTCRLAAKRLREAMTELKGNEPYANIDKIHNTLFAVSDMLLDLASR